MKPSNDAVPGLRKPIDAKRREQLLAEFDRSGLSSATFARQHGLHYTTFCGWRQRRAKASSDFIEVELPTPPAPVELTVELGAGARMRLCCVDQVELASRLIRALNAPTAC